jgi:hypothetical protein
MKRAGTFLLCLAGGLALAAATRADDLASADNPYATVVSRNIFGLLPPPTNPPEQKPPDPPVKITANGIMSIFGEWQVLFKTSVNKPGQPPKDQSYMLSEGQQEDDIEVVKIDHKASIVTFNNHGIVQELPLANAPTGGGPGGSSPGNPGPGFRNFPGRPGMGGGGPGAGYSGAFGTSGGGFGRGNPGEPGSNPSGYGGGGNPNGAANLSRGPNVNENGVYQPEASTLSAEEAAVTIAAQHLKAIQDGSPTAPLFPPTAIDKEAGISGPGSPASGDPTPP